MEGEGPERGRLSPISVSGRRRRPHATDPGSASWEGDRDMGSGPLELIAEARAGRAEALGELCSLYRNYMRMVVRTGLGPKLRERLELSDVVQEALVEVVRQFPQFTGQNEAALVGWLRRLVGQKLAHLGRYPNRGKRG